MASLDITDTMCPVCTLYLRPGITLKQHLASHPKQKVIDALVKASLQDEPLKVQGSQPTGDISEGVSTLSPNGSPSNGAMPPYLNQVPVGSSSSMGSQLPGNHFFMYQQSMSTSSPHQPSVSSLTFNPFAQQYLVPAVYNAQMMPYFYQQQQLIMSSNGIPPPHIRALPFEASNSSQSTPVVNRPILDGLKEKIDVGKVTEIDQDGLNSQGESQSSEEDDDRDEPAANVSDTTANQEEHPNTEYKEEETEGVISLLEEDNSPAPQYQESMYQGCSEEYQNHQEIDHEECVGTPLSHASNSEWNLDPDLNKACQTQTNSALSPSRSIHADDQAQSSEQTPEFLFLGQRSNVSVVLSSENMPSNFETPDAVYNSNNLLSSGDAVDFMNVEDIEGMQVILGDFSNATIIPHENFETRQNNSPPIVMTISGVSMSPKTTNDGFIHIVQPKNHEQQGPSCIENVNIRSDEKMPPRGELSGQESMGSASDVTWNQIQHYQEQGPMCFEPTSWDSNSEMNSFTEDTEKIEIDNAVLMKEEDIKENVPANPSRPHKKLVGIEVGRNRPRKLLIKQRRPKKEPQTSFNNIFTNKLKTESGTTGNQLPGPIDEIKSEDQPVGITDRCKECNKTFKTKKELRAHNSEFHRLSRIKGNKCLICQEVFDVEHKFNEHLQIHPLECHICGKLFFRRQGLKLHIARHEGLKPYKCDLCEKAFLVKQKLEEHRNCHTGNAPIKCTMCPETFKRHSNLVQHRNRHHFFIKRKLKDFVCFCGEVYHSKKKFDWHKEKHDTKPKACTQCSEKFIHNAGLTRHMRRAHNAEYLPDGRDPNTLNRVCPVCKGVYLKSSMEAHMQTHRNNKPFACSVCNKKFTTKWNLKLHKWTHAPRTQKPFKCAQCKGAFIRENDYIAHMNSHKSVRPYTCNHCGAQFIRKYNCQRHVKEHENEKTYVCNVCNKSFHRSYYLKDHMRVHTGLRPYSCHICGKTSTTKSNHNKHIQIHHAREPVSTEN